MTKKTASKKQATNTENGMSPAPSAETRKAKTAAKFAEADAKADPDADELDAIRKGLQVRGY